MRKATHDDLDSVVDMGADFHAFSPWREIPFDRDSTKAFCARLLDGGAIFINEGGMIGGLLNPLYFNPAYVVGAELFWWGRKHGDDLRIAFEDWSKENNAVGCQFSTLWLGGQDRVGELLEGAGYRKVEAGYYKELL